MKKNFVEIEICVKSKLNQNFSALKHCRCRKEPALELEYRCVVKEEEQDVLTQF